MVSVSFIRTHPIRLILFIPIIVPFILIARVIFYEEHVQTFPCISVLSSSTHRNNIRNKEHLAHIHQPFSLSILRGIVIFYPNDQEPLFFPELLWLYRSWVEMMKDESPLWRTDLVIYTGDYTLNLQRIGCSYQRVRIDRDEAPQCRVFPYERILLRNPHTINHHVYQQFDKNRSTLLIEHLKTYKYIDSINIIAECYPSFSMYDYILRTDIDVFLTKNFGRFVPYSDILLVGQGAYASNFSKARLRRIAKDMNWLSENITNLGSTWYGPPEVAQRIANFSLKAMIYLAINEFTTAEKQGRLGTLLWPEWHFGVLTMYGSELAINHLMLSENLNIGLADELLDQFTTEKDPYDIERNNRLHLHAWFHREPFSKLYFEAGKYDHINPNIFINDTSAYGFAMRMALESRLMSFNDLHQALLNAKHSSRS